MSSTPEGKVKEKVRKALHDCGIYTFPVNQQGIGRRGIPDDFMMFNGVPCFIEFKAEMRFDKNNKAALSTWPTVLQILEMEKARKSGMRTYVIDKNNMDEFIDATKKGVFYVHAWDIELRDYEWYRDAPPAFIKEFWKEHEEKLRLWEPYQIIHAMAGAYKYAY